MTRRQAVALINKNTLLLSLLYDLNLMPEQVKSGTRQEAYMFAVVEHMMRAAEERK